MNNTSHEQFTHKNSMKIVLDWQKIILGLDNRQEHNSATDIYREHKSPGGEDDRELQYTTS